MSNHDESLIDKVKNAFGMGGDGHADHEEHADHDVADRGIGTDPLDTSERTEGWAGVDDALGGTENRPAGPDYGGDPVTGTNDDAFGTTAAPLGGGASGSYTGVGESLDPDRQQGTDEAGWTRGEAASGQSGLDDETLIDDPLNPRRDDPI